MLGPDADRDLAEVLAHTVNGPVRELLERGGQRWRVPIGRLAYAACGGEGEPPAALDLIEILHTASLVIDDIQDGSDRRRGGPSAHVAHGIPVALGAANTAYFRVLALLRDALPPEVCLRAYDMLATEMLAAHLGQALDLGLSGPAAATAPSERHYVVLARAKTGALVRIAARLGAIAASATDADESALSEWGSEIGLAYQIRDDVEDAAGAGGDAESGRLSYPVVAAAALEAGTPVVEIEERCREAARRALARGLAALERLPPSAARQDLVRLSERLAGS